MSRIRGLITAVVLAAASLGPAPVAAADPNPDAAILSPEEVGAIAGTGLTPDAAQDLRKPGGNHQYDAQYPAACHPVFDQDVAFAGVGPFHSVTYMGTANRSITQAVGIYPSGNDAKLALKNLADSLLACSSQNVPNMALTVQVLDALTMAVCFSQCSTLYRVTGPALLAVDVEKFSDAGRIAATVMQQAGARAKSL